MKLLYLIALFLAFAAQFASAQRRCARAWEDYNFEGQSTQLCQGRMNVPAGWNDRISSINVPAGWRLRVWQDYDFQGAARTFVGPYRGNVPQIWNDQISSYGYFRS